ncbi:MAG: hypothetical protein RIC35_02515 [Marinoscillum sp.]
MNTLYFGEIVAKLSAHIHGNPDKVKRITATLDQFSQDSIWTICSDAARVFDKIEDLSGEHFINWHQALEIYADYILNHLLSNRQLNIVDMISLASKSIQDSRAT